MLNFKCRISDFKMFRRLGLIRNNLKFFIESKHSDRNSSKITRKDFSVHLNDIFSTGYENILTNEKNESGIINFYFTKSENLNFLIVRINIFYTHIWALKFSIEKDNTINVLVYLII